MTENTETGSQAVGRSIEPLAFGDTADEIELDALDKARKFFGIGPVLEVVREYRVIDARPGSAQAGEAGGKAWYARVTVREPANG
jgi:hypothetical protein